jgi:hypothetical protein
MTLEKFCLGFYIGVLLTLHAYSFFTKNSRNLHTIAVTLYYLNIRPGSSETEGIMSTAYLPCGAKYLLRNSFHLRDYKISFIACGLRSSLGKPFLVFCRAVLSQPSARPDCQHSDRLSMLVSVSGLRKKSWGVKFGEMAYAAIHWFYVLSKILWRIMAVFSSTLSWRRNLFLVIDNTGRRCWMLSCKYCSTPL